MLTLDHLSVARESFNLKANLSLPKGNICAVLGPSGAGKSTLLSAIAGFEQFSGRIFWEGKNLDGIAPARRPMAMLFQDGNLFPHLDLRRNLGLALTRRYRLSPEQDQKILHALERVGLAQYIRRKPGTLSGGQQSRAALARVLLQQKPVLLLDEPFAALDPAQRQNMMDLVRDLATASGQTVLMVTHDPVETRRICDSVIFVSDGQVRAPQKMAEFLSQPGATVQTYLGS